VEETSPREVPPLPVEPTEEDDEVDEVESDRSVRKGFSMVVVVVFGSDIASSCWCVVGCM